MRGINWNVWFILGAGYHGYAAPAVVAGGYGGYGVSKVVSPYAAPVASYAAPVASYAAPVASYGGYGGYAHGTCLISLHHTNYLIFTK